MDAKQRLRTELRQRRRDHVKAQPQTTRGLLFLRPPGVIGELVPDGAVVGLYHPLPAEAPTRGYAKWFSEHGHAIALPWFADRTAPMRFRLWEDPYDDDGLEVGPWGTLQPGPDATELVPTVAFVPLLGFSSDCDRLGQGGGHYDRWLAAHPSARAIGLAWDPQLIERLPVEAHDRPLDAVITPTRLYRRTREGLS